MKKFLTFLAFFIGLLLVGSTVVRATSVFIVQQGGTGSTTLSGIIAGNGTSPVQTVTIGTGLNFSGTTLSATGGASTDFTYLNNFGGVTAASSSAFWIQGPLYASSTLNVSSAVNLASTSVYVTGLGLYVPTTVPLENPLQTIISNFKSSDPIVHTGGGSMATDTVNYVIGTSSIELTTAGDAASDRAEIDSISPTIDLTHKVIHLWIQAHNVNHIALLQVRVSSDNQTGSYAWSIQNIFQTSASSASWKNDTWIPLTLSLGTVTTVTGTVDISKINSIQYRVVDDGTQAVNAWINQVSFYPEPSSGAVSFTFDDGRVTQYTAAKPILDTYGYPATAYVISQEIGSGTWGNHMTTAQLSTLQNNGWEIGVHDTYTLTTLSNTDLENQLLKDKNFALDNGFYSGSNDFAYPLGEFSTTTEGYIAKYFRSARSIVGGATGQTGGESIPPANYYGLRVIEPSFNTSTSSIEAVIQNCQTYHSWCIVVLHDVVDPATISTQFSALEFQAIVNYVNSIGLPVRTITDVLNGGEASNAFNQSGLFAALGSKGLSLGSTTPYARLSIQANVGDKNTTLFAIGSSTATATTTLFSIDNTGTASTTKLFGALLTPCIGSNALQWNNGTFACAATTGGSSASTTLLGDTNTWSGSETFNNPINVTTTTGTSTIGNALTIGGANSYLLVSSTTPNYGYLALDNIDAGGSANAPETITNFNNSTGNCAFSAYISAAASAGPFLGNFSLFGHSSTGYNGIGCPNQGPLPGPDSTLIYDPTGNITSYVGGANMNFGWYIGNATTSKMILNKTGLGVASSSPAARLAVQANPTDAVINSMLFLIGSSTQTATTTLFSVSNTGAITTNLAGSGFVKTTGAGSQLSVDTNTYLTSNQTITLSGVVTGSGSTAITTAFGSQSAGVLGSAITGNTTVLATSTLFGSNGIPNSALTNSSVTVNTSAPLGGGGSVSLGGTLTLTCASCSTFGFPFTPTNNFGMNTNATSTPLSLSAGLFASSTVVFGSSATTSLNWNSRLGTLSLGSTTPFSMFTLFAASTTGSLIEPTTLFEIASSTALGATSTLFSISNTGAASSTSLTVSSLGSGATTNVCALTTGALTITGCNNGTVTSISVASANGFAGSSSGGATPQLTITTSITGLLKGNGTAISAAAYTDFPTMSANTLLANGTAGTAAPTAIATSTLYGNCTGGNVVGWSNTIGGLGCIATSSSATLANTLANGLTATTTFYSGGVVFSDASKLTQAPNTTANSLFYDNVNGLFGVGTSTPYAKLSVSGGDTALKETTDSATAFSVFNAASTATFQVGTINIGGLYWTVASSSLTTQLGLSGDGNLAVGAGTGASTTPQAAITASVASSTAALPFYSIWLEQFIGGINYVVFSIDYYGHVVYDGPATTVSSCGSAPSGSVAPGSNDTNGVIIIGGTSPTACTLNFAKQRRNNFECTISDSSTSITPDISATTTQSITYSLSAALGGGYIYYNCADFK